MTSPSSTLPPRTFTPLPKPSPPPARTSPPSPTPPSSSLCSPLTLSSSLPLCPRLVCLSCDHGVMSIPSFAFLPSVDYLFLRTVVPNVARLQERMEPRVHCTAFCCQCSHLNCQGSVRVDRSTHRWVCTGHSP